MTINTNVGSFLPPGGNDNAMVFRSVDSCQIGCASPEIRQAAEQILQPVAQSNTLQLQSPKGRGI